MRSFSPVRRRSTRSGSVLLNARTFAISDGGRFRAPFCPQPNTTTPSVSPHARTPPCRQQRLSLGARLRRQPRAPDGAPLRALGVDRLARPRKRAIVPSMKRRASAPGRAHQRPAGTSAVTHTRALRGSVKMSTDGSDLVSVEALEPKRCCEHGLADDPAAPRLPPSHASSKHSSEALHP
jgi:hypothetical protein